MMNVSKDLGQQARRLLCIAAIFCVFLAPVLAQNKATVYMTTDISPAGLKAVYEALGRKPTGKVAVKISTGEPGGHNFLQPALIGIFVKSLNATIVESNTAYGGRRANTAMHKQVAKDHGFTATLPVGLRPKAS
jgi:uncharacterized Fe-S center protein